MREGWKSDVTPLMRRISQVATGPASLFVLAASSRLALALPANRKAARIVSDLYQPQRWKGRLFLGIAKWMIAFGVPRYRPTHLGTVRTIPEVAWLKEAAERGSIGFLGCNPNHGPRCVLAGIDPVSENEFIAKLGLEQSAASIRREADFLEHMKGRFLGVIHSMGLENGGPESDFDWALLRLPHLGCNSPKSMEEPEIGKLLENWLGNECTSLGRIDWASSLLDRVATDQAPHKWHNRMRSRTIRKALLHGDFAIWNLRKTSGGFVAIDWEWGQEDGVGGIDLAHGLRQECYMVRGMKPKRAVARMLEQADSKLWRGYLAQCGWEGAHEDWLRLGLLHSHFNAANPSGELLEILGITVN